MNEPIKFSNIIKFDLNKCTFCENCIKVCQFSALSIENENINFDNTLKIKQKIYTIIKEVK